MHYVFIENFVGKGYNQEFVENMASLINQLNENPESFLELCCEIDIICECCPNAIGNQCNSFEKVLEFDKNLLNICNLQEKIIISWQQLKKISSDRILIPKKLEQVCEGCCWINICSKIIKSYAN